MPNENTWITAPVWKDWRILTRTLYCSRIAFQAEISKWSYESVEIHGDVLLRFADGEPNFKTWLPEHIETLSDGSFFYSMLLLRAVSLLESHAKMVRYIIDTNKWDLFERETTDTEREDINTLVLRNGIAGWGTTLLMDVGQSWGRVYKERPGLEEVIFIRNAIAHGYGMVTPGLYTKITEVAPDFPLAPYDEIRISHDLLREYTGRIKSLIRILCDGVYHTGKSF